VIFSNVFRWRDFSIWDEELCVSLNYRFLFLVSLVI